MSDFEGGGPKVYTRKILIHDVVLQLVAIYSNKAVVTFDLNDEVLSVLALQSQNLPKHDRCFCPNIFHGNIQISQK